MNNVHTRNDLKQLQALPLDIKIEMSKIRIRQWVDEYTIDGVYVSFSGGKDSTVLLHIVRSIYPDTPAVFVDTGLEYPEIRQFVRSFDNVTWLRPKMNFKQVIETYGYPFFSKEISHKFDDMYSAHEKGKHSYVDDQLKGTYISKNGKTNLLSITKYRFMVDSPFKISHRCCNVMKKLPMKHYEKSTGRYGKITGLLAEESQLRLQHWLHEGCNAFKYNTSNPLSFWTEQDILKYIKINNIPIASVYGDIVYANDQISIFEPDLKTTGCNRVGCMFCGFGCHLEESPNRFEKMKVTHPKQYEYIMRDWNEGGLGYKKVIDWINEHGNMNIKY